jgi:hypothetical protein
MVCVYTTIDSTAICCMRLAAGLASSKRPVRSVRAPARSSCALTKKSVVAGAESGVMSRCMHVAVVHPCALNRGHTTACTAFLLSSCKS